jgi:hypothetical protein
MSTPEDLSYKIYNALLDTNEKRNTNYNVPIIMLNSPNDYTCDLLVNINSINEIPHNIISQPEPNKFIIKLNNPAISVLACFFSTIFTLTLLNAILFESINKNIFSLSFLFFLSLSFNVYKKRTFTFILNETNIEVQKNDLCKNVTYFKANDIRKIKFEAKERFKNTYYYIVVEKNFTDVNLTINYGSIYYTQEEMRYFCDVINKHIDKMNNRILFI